VRVLSRLFRRLFLEGLAGLNEAGRLQFFGELAPLIDKRAFDAWLAPLRRSEWVVYAKRPFAGPKAVLAYLSRYTHRVAISNSRLIKLDAAGVTFKYKDYRSKGRDRLKTMTLDAAEFIRRFLLHVLPTGFVQRREAVEKEAAEQAREHAHGQEEPSLAGDPTRTVGRKAATRDDDVEVGVVGERRAPGVQHGGEADARAQMLGIGGDGHQRLGGGPEHQVVDGGLVGEGHRAKRRRQSEDDVIIGNGQQFGLAFGEPSLGCGGLTLRAVAIAAGVVDDARMRAVFAALDVSAERGGAASLDRRHDLQLAKADMACVGDAPRRAMGAKDVGDLQRRPRHAALSQAGGDGGVGLRPS